MTQCFRSFFPLSLIEPHNLRRYLPYTSAHPFFPTHVHVIGPLAHASLRHLSFFLSIYSVLSSLILRLTRCEELWEMDNFLTSTTSSSLSLELPSKPVTTPLVVQKFQQTSSNIAGTSTNLTQSLKELEAGDCFRHFFLVLDSALWNRVFHGL